MGRLKIIIFNKYVPKPFRYHDIPFIEHATFNIGNTPIGLYTFVMGQQHNKSPPQTNNLNKGGVSHYALTIYIKKYLKAKKEL
jgi:hypothetical protein